MKLLLPFILLCKIEAASAQDSTNFIRINFLYGSKPAKGYKESEKKRFGGIKGGHVNIEYKGRCLDFSPGGNCHVFPSHKNPNGHFVVNNGVRWDTLKEKSAYILVPVTSAQADSLQSIFNAYSNKTPYDYAVFGNRCASASYQALSLIGITEKRSATGNVISNFYPKLLRKKLFKWAKEHNYTLKKFEGRPSRKWEKDEGWF